MVRITKDQSHLRLVVNRDDDLFDDPRRYAQSTSARSDSHVTSPLDSRSMFTASDSPQGRRPYATLRRWPTVVLHRSAKLDRSAGSIPVKNSLNSMPDYHHTVIERATPFGDFTGWCRSSDNKRMTRKQKADIRRANLRRFIDLHMERNLSELARCYAKYKGGRAARPTFFSDVMRGEKGFGETLAEDLENAVRLKTGQLSLADSPLELREPLAKKAAEALTVELSGLNGDESDEVLAFVQELKTRRKQRKRTTR